MAAAPIFSYKDWVVVCDNTRSCQAAGFQAEGEESEPMALQLTRRPDQGTGCARPSWSSSRANSRKHWRSRWAHAA